MAPIWVVVADIACDCDRRSALGADLVGDPLCRGLVLVRDDDVRALLGEAVGTRASHA